MTINCLYLNTIHQLSKRQFRIYNHFSLFAFHFSLFAFHFSFFIFHSSPTYPTPSIRWLHFSLFTFHFSLFTHIPSSKYSLASLFTLNFSLVPPSGARGIIHFSLTKILTVITLLSATSSTKKR